MLYAGLEKAFDKPHRRLISNLCSYNIDNDVVKWLKSFLRENRR